MIKTIALSLLFASMTQAANIVWTNTAGGNWGAANNWSPNQIPGAADTAYITNSGTYTVTLNVAATVAGMDLGGLSGAQTFSDNGQTFTLNGQVTVSPNGAFNFISGGLAGTGVLSGAMNVEGGQINFGGSFTVSASGVLNLLGSGTFALEGPLTNNGTVNWLGGAVEIVNNNNANYAGAIWNQSGAQWLIQCGQPLQYSQDLGLYEIFNNAGLLCKTNVSGSTTFSVYLNNTGGSVQAQIGAINFANGCNLAGTFQAAAGAAIDFTGGNYLWNGTAVFNGPGSVQFTGGTVSITAAITSPFVASGVTISNVGNLRGGAYLTNCVIAQAETVLAAVTWAGGIVPSTGSLTVSAGGVLNIVSGGSGLFQIEGPLTNNGTVNWLGDEVQIVNNDNTTYKGAIWNQGGAQFLMECNQPLQYSQDSGVYEIFNNAGSVVKTNVAGTTSFNVYLNNTGGLAQAQIGIIAFANGCNLAGGFQADAGAAIEFTAGNYLWNGTEMFGGPGSVQITGGTVTITAPLNSPFAVSGVTISNVSNIQAGGYLTNCSIAQAESIVGTVTWAGTVVPSTASLTVAAGGVLNIVSGGSGLFQIEGPLTNNGTVNWLGDEVQIVNNDNTTYKGAIWNQAGAQFLMECAQTVQDSQDSGLYEIFYNAGSVIKTNVAGITSFNVYLNNTGGSVVGQIGTIDFQNGGNLAGTFQAAAGAAINFSGGNYLWNGTEAFQGPGSVQFTGGTVTITSAVTGPFIASGATISNLSNLQGAAYLTNCTIAQAETIVGAVTWAGAVVPSTVSLTVSANGVLNIVGGGNGLFQVEGPLTNNGTVNWLGDEIQIVNNNNITYKGAIWNQAGARFLMECTQTLENDVATGYEIFYNAGLFCKTNVTGTTTINVGVSNTTGTVDAEIGVMDFANGCNFGPAGTMSFGISNLSSFGEITMSGTAALNGSLAAHLNGGYVPVVSNAFTLLNFTAFTGAFANTNLPLAAVWQTNYASTSLSIKVLKLVPQLAWPDPADIVYGAALSGAQLDAAAASPTNLNGTLAGAFVYNPVIGTILQSGRNRTLSVTFTPTDTASNAAATTNVSINVMQAPLTVTATNRGKIYGQVVTFAGTEFVTSGLVNGDSVTGATLASAGDPGTAPVIGSPYTITVTNAVGGAGLTNYLVTYDTGNLTVTPAPLTITAAGQGKSYGLNLNPGTTAFTTTALSNSDTVTGVTLSSPGAAGTATVAGSPYAITASAAVGTGLGNYTITYDPGSLIVSKAPLSVTANAQSKTYGQNLALGTTAFTTGALYNGDTVSGVTLASSGAAATATVYGSPYLITPSAAAGTGLANYNIAYNTGNLTVGAAPLTITPNAQSKTYGQVPNLGTTAFTNTPLFNSDTVTGVTLTSRGAGAAASVAGSPYLIDANGAVGTGLTNYNITYGTGLLTVTFPTLSFAANLPNLTMTWTTNASVFVLNRSASLNPPATWTPVTNAISVNGTNNTVTLPASSGNGYFSLIAPFL